MCTREPILSLTKKDFDVTWFSGKGAGGQHRNKHQNCCRIIHKPSGAMGIGQTERTRPANQKSAFNTLVKSKKFQAWLKIEIGKKLVDESELEKLVDAQMKNVKVEYLVNGKWEDSKVVNPNTEEL